MKSDKTLAGGVMALGILGGVFQFILGFVSAVGLGLMSSLDASDAPAWLGMDAAVAGEVVALAAVIAGTASIAGGAMARGAAKAALILLWIGVVAGVVASPFATILVLIAAIMHTVGIRRMNKPMVP